MVISSWGITSLRVFRENLALLRILNDLPEEEKEHSLEDYLRRQGPNATSHRLSIERERDLVDHLAFLSATSDDPAKVMAVCVEENPQDPNTLTIRLAMNEGDLRILRTDYQKMTRVLEEISVSCIITGRLCL